MVLCHLCKLANVYTTIDNHSFHGKNPLTIKGHFKYRVMLVIYYQRPKWHAPWHHGPSPVAMVLLLACLGMGRPQDIDHDDHGNMWITIFTAMDYPLVIMASWKIPKLNGFRAGSPHCRTMYSPQHLDHLKSTTSNSRKLRLFRACWAPNADKTGRVSVSVHATMTSINVDNVRWCEWGPEQKGGHKFHQKWWLIRGTNIQLIGVVQQYRKIPWKSWANLWFPVNFLP